MEPSPPKPFRLLNLPSCALHRAFKFWSPIELTNLSFLSKNSYEVVRNFPKDKTLKLEINSLFKGCIKIIFSGYVNFFTFFALGEKDEKIKKNVKAFTQKLGDQSGKFVMKSEKYLVTYWDDKISGLFELVKHVSGIFHKAPISSVYTDTRYMNRELYDWIVKRGKVEKWVTDTSHTDTSEEDIKYILNICRITKDLIYYSASCPNLKYIPEFDMDSIWILGAQWIHLEHLLALSNQTIVLKLYSTSLTNEDVNEFLKKMVASGKKFKLKFLSVSYLLLNMDDVLSEIVFKELKPETETVFQLYNGNVRFHGGWEI